MKIFSIIDKFLNIFRKLGFSLQEYRLAIERQRELNLEINEIKEWSKFEKFYGNDRLL
jgi:hypothetical protein